MEHRLFLFSFFPTLFRGIIEGKVKRVFLLQAEEKDGLVRVLLPFSVSLVFYPVQPHQKRRAALSPFFFFVSSDPPFTVAVRKQIKKERLSVAAGVPFSSISSFPFLLLGSKVGKMEE